MVVICSTILLKNRTKDISDDISYDGISFDDIDLEKCDIEIFVSPGLHVEYPTNPYIHYYFDLTNRIWYKVESFSSSNKTVCEYELNDDDIKELKELYTFDDENDMKDEDAKHADDWGVDTYVVDFKDGTKTKDIPEYKFVKIIHFISI